VEHWFSNGRYVDAAFSLRQMKKSAEQYGLPQGEYLAQLDNLKASMSEDDISATPFYDLHPNNGLILYGLFMRPENRKRLAGTERSVELQRLASEIQEASHMFVDHGDGSSWENYIMLLENGRVNRFLSEEEVTCLLTNSGKP